MGWLRYSITLESFVHCFQTLIKTEILKNQLQIHASISQQQQHQQLQHQLSPPSLHSSPSPPAPNPPPTSSPTSLLSSLSNSGGPTGGSFNFTPSPGVTGRLISGDGNGKTPKLPISRLPTATPAEKPNETNSTNFNQGQLVPYLFKATLLQHFWPLPYVQWSVCLPLFQRRVLLGRHHKTLRRGRSTTSLRRSIAPVSMTALDSSGKWCPSTAKTTRRLANPLLLSPSLSPLSSSYFSPLLHLTPQLQKSAVLQKTIDFIRHLEATIKRLQEENRQLKDMLAKATGQSRLAGYNQSPPVTPPSISPRSSISSGEDSGVPPSSPDCTSVSYMV